MLSSTDHHPVDEEIPTLLYSAGRDSASRLDPTSVQWDLRLMLGGAVF